VLLRFDGRPVLVVGGGMVATRKVEGLIQAGAKVTVVAPLIVAELRALALANEIVTLVERSFTNSDVFGAWYVVAATGDPAVQQAIADECERQSVWCNAVDDPERCTALLPAVHRNGDVVVAVSTSGASPTLARILRDRIAQALPQDLHNIAAILAKRRKSWQEGGSSTEDRDWAPEIDELLAQSLPSCPAFRKTADAK
jgi:siroheme synthase-like protein